MSPEHTPKARIRRWLEQAVIGLNLCPFASIPYRSGNVKIVVAQFDDGLGDELSDALVEAIVGCVLTLTVELIEAGSDGRSTTLLVLESGLADFEQFLEVAGVIEAALEQTAAATQVQLATFHPDYRFEGVEPNALSNFTNRSPYPVFHLIRVKDVTEAVQQHPDIDSVPRDNIATLEQMGRSAVRRLWSGWDERMEEGAQ